MRLSPLTWWHFWHCVHLLCTLLIIFICICFIYIYTLHTRCLHSFLLCTAAAAQQCCCCNLFEIYSSEDVISCFHLFNECIPTDELAEIPIKKPQQQQGCTELKFDAIQGFLYCYTLHWCCALTRVGSIHADSFGFVCSGLR